MEPVEPVEPESLNLSPSSRVVGLFCRHCVAPLVLFRVLKLLSDSLCQVDLARWGKGNAKIQARCAGSHLNIENSELGEIWRYGNSKTNFASDCCCPLLTS